MKLLSSDDVSYVYGGIQSVYVDIRIPEMYLLKASEIYAELAMNQISPHDFFNSLACLSRGSHNSINISTIEIDTYFY